MYEASLMYFSSSLCTWANFDGVWSTWESHHDDSFQPSSFY